MQKRDARIETLRGLACVLLVAYHVVGGNPNSGLTLGSGYLRELNDLLALIRMPLFTFISGFVYAYRPYNPPWQAYVRGKARRLLVPMLCVGTLFAIMQYSIPGTNAKVDNWALLHIIPYAHFWFLESLFIIFLVLIPLETKNLLNTQARWLYTFIAACVVYLLNPEIPYFGIGGACYLFPFFLAGLYFSRFGLSQLKPLRYLLPLITLVSLALVYSNPQLTRDTHNSLAALVIGLLGCTALIHLGWKNRLLSAIGTYSYSIYIFHVFFTAGSRMISRHFQISEVEVLLLLGIVCGISGPIVIDLIFSQSRLTRVLFLGKR